jgi:hypothetical protein
MTTISFITHLLLYIFGMLIGYIIGVRVTNIKIGKVLTNEVNKFIIELQNEKPPV